MIRKILPHLMFLTLTVLLFNSCKKEEEEEVKEVNPCGTTNCCFKVGSETLSFDLKWIYIRTSNLCKMYYFEELGGTNSERLDIEFVNSAGVTVGEYALSNKPDNQLVDGDARLKYSKNFNGTRTEYSCLNGKLNITKVESNQITGTFTCEGENFERVPTTIADGNLYKVVRF